MIDDLHLLRPYWLMALVPLILTAVWYARRRPGLLRWADVVDEHLAPYVLIGGASASRRFAAVLLGLAGTLAIVALAGPAWKKLPQPVFANEASLVILLDLSNSMNTQDIKPSRLERARFKVADILDRRNEGQTALIVYAANAYVVSPLTDDVATIAAQLSALTPALMPSQGSRADLALDKARQLLEQAGRRRGEVLLVSDGVDADRARPAVASLVESGFRVSVLGVGTVDGGPVPGNGGFIKNRDGSIVIAALNRDDMRSLALAGGGLYRDLSADDRDIEQLSGILEALPSGDVSERELDADQWREEGPWLLLLLMPLAALVFRRGILAVFALMFCLPMVPAEAAGLGDLWLRPDQSGARELAAGNAERAAELFEDPAWLGAARYRAGDYDGALQALQQLDTADAAYNGGNALARLGRYEEAIAAYEAAIERDPEHNDAQFNRDLLLEQMQNQEQQSEQDGEGEEQQSDNNDSQQGESSEGEQSQQAQQDQGESSPDSADESQSGQEADQSEAEQEAERLAQERSEAEESADEDEQQSALPMAQADETLDEAEQAVEQWLRRIPDDPGGLLRRKFLYQYQQQEQPQVEQEPW